MTDKWGLLMKMDKNSTQLKIAFEICFLTNLSCLCLKLEVVFPFRRNAGCLPIHVILLGQHSMIYDGNKLFWERGGGVLNNWYEAYLITKLNLSVLGWIWQNQAEAELCQGQA